MLTLVQSPTELSTAATDVLLSLVALAGILRLQMIRTHRRWRQGLWIGLMGLVALVGLMGAAAHGVQMAEPTRDGLWRVLNLLVVLLLAGFALAGILDWLGRDWMLKLAPVVLIPALAVYGALYLFDGTWLWVMLFEVTVMILALGIYTLLARRRRIAGAGLIALGLVVTILAAAVQMMQDLRWTLIWEFDNNGLFHLIQVVGILFLVAGVYREFDNRGSSSTS